jgi:hypothetical protein
MLKKVLLAVVLTLSVFSAINVQASAPPPTCGDKNNPCPWVF